MAALTGTRCPMMALSTGSNTDLVFPKRNPGILWWSSLTPPSGSKPLAASATPTRSSRLLRAHSAPSPHASASTLKPPPLIRRVAAPSGVRVDRHTASPSTTCARLPWANGPRVSLRSIGWGLVTVRRTPHCKRDEGRHGWRPSSNKLGGDLLSRGPAPQVPSAQAGLTSVFGMGTGGSPPLSPP